MVECGCDDEIKYLEYVFEELIELDFKVGEEDVLIVVCLLMMNVE